MKQLDIEIRSNGVSIQGPGIANKTEEAKEILKKALAALEKKPDFQATNELFFLENKK